MIHRERMEEKDSEDFLRRSTAEVGKEQLQPRPFGYVSRCS